MRVLFVFVLSFWLCYCCNCCLFLLFGKKSAFLKEMSVGNSDTQRGLWTLKCLYIYIHILVEKPNNFLKEL